MHGSRLTLEHHLRRVYRAARERPLKPGHLGVIARDYARLPYLASRGTHKYTGLEAPARSTVEHLEETMRWLCRAQDVGNDRGVSTAYSFRHGWMASYPETTGYIVTTFFDYASLAGAEEYRRRALEMAEWLTAIQLENGAFQGGPVDKPPEPSVFNTGQILLGLARAHRETGDPRYLDAATRASDWLVSVQDDDGAWRRNAYNGIPHVYYTRVAWALLEVDAVAGVDRYAGAARAQLEWALGHQRSNGWFASNSFDGRARPFTHNIVYAAEGLLGAFKLLGDQRYRDSAAAVAEPLAWRFETEKFVAGDLDADWQSPSRYTCLTGNAQLAGLLLDLFEREGDARNLNTALKLNEYLKSTQSLTSRHGGIRGGLAGSDPVWGGYLTFSFPNWAAKFLADSLLEEERIMQGLGESG
jgi:uncharacterized protein YyaL (SSP411 family)